MRSSVKFVFIFSMFLFLVGSVISQDRSNLTPQEPQKEKPAVFLRALRQLELTPEQIEKIREVNKRMRPLIMQARRGLQEANRLLDEAIYANSLDENLVEERIKAVQAAQAEVLRLRIQNEVELRKILTPEQLEKFRQLRQQRKQQTPPVVPPVPAPPRTAPPIPMRRPKGF